MGYLFALVKNKTGLLSHLVFQVYKNINKMLFLINLKFNCVK